jgi:hypothetical protein
MQVHNYQLVHQTLCVFIAITSKLDSGTRLSTALPSAMTPDRRAVQLQTQTSNRTPPSLESSAHTAQYLKLPASNAHGHLPISLFCWTS